MIGDDFDDGDWLDESLFPDPIILNLLATMRLHAPDRFDEAMAAAVTPLPHDGSCCCPGCLAARLALNQPPPLRTTLDQPHRQEDPNMPKTKTAGQRVEPPPPTPADAAAQRPPLPCYGCGVLVEQPPMWVSPVRRCPDCHGKPISDLRAAALAALGIESDPASPEVASADVAWLHSPPADVPRNNIDPMTGKPYVPPPPNDQPWGHLDPRAVRRALAEARARINADTRPAPHPDGGACPGCGVTTSTGWLDYGSRILCTDCGDAWQRSGGSEVGWRNRLAGEAIGVKPGMALAARYGFHVFAEVDAQPATVRFGYLDPAIVEQCRHAHWVAFPTQAPAEFTAKQQRIAAARAKVTPPTAPPPPLTAPGRGHLPTEVN